MSLLFLLLIFFWSFLLSTTKMSFLFNIFVVELKGSVQMSWHLVSDETHRAGVHTYNWTGNSSASLQCQGAKIHHANTCMCSKTPQPAVTITSFCLYLSADWTLQESAGAPWTSMCALNKPNEFWQQGWMLPGGILLVEVGIGPVSPTPWVILELSLENLRNHNGWSLSASSHWCRTALAR